MSKVGKKPEKKVVVKRPRGFREEDKLRYVTCDEALAMTNQQHDKKCFKQLELVKELEIKLVQERINTLKEMLNRLAFEKNNTQKRTKESQGTINKYNEQFCKDYEINTATHTWGWVPLSLELIITPKEQ